MTDYRDPVPDDRTIVPGIWSDFMDKILSSIEVSNRNNVGVAVYIQDQTTRPFSLPFTTNRTAFTLASNAVVNSRTITAVAGHGIVDGNIIEIAENNTFLICRVVDVATNVITLDQPVNYPYTTSAFSYKSSDNLLVNGSIDSVVFSLKPNLLQAGDITRIKFELIAGSSMDFATFGALDALTNGVVVRINRGDGTYFNLFNVKTNGDIIAQSSDYSFLIPKTGSAEFGFSSQVTWAGQQNHGVAIRVDGALNESLEIVVQDDLTTGNTVFKMIGQGSELQD